MKSNNILPALKQKQDSNEVELKNKASEPVDIATTEVNSAFQSLFDAGWILTENEDIEGATTQVLEYELPQKATYNFNFSLAIPEVYLPFINISLFAKPVDPQKIVGAAQYTYSGLEEVLIHLYNWQGLTQKVGSTGMPHVDVYQDDGTTLPPKPEPTWDDIPPSACYNKISYYTSIWIHAGGFPEPVFSLTPDGTHCSVNGVWYTTQAVIQNWINIWNPPDHPGGGTLWVTWYFAQSITFQHQAINFPLPDDGESLLPCGGTNRDEYSTPEYPNQYWEQQAILTFQEYMAYTGKTYAQAVALFSQYYPDLYITPFSHGYPYKCYRRINKDVVETSKQSIQITRINENLYQFIVTGYLLLNSPSITEVSWSDPDFPTYMPSSPPLLVCLKAHLKGHPVKILQTKAYKQ